MVEGMDGVMLFVIDADLPVVLELDGSRKLNHTSSPVPYLTHTSWYG